MNAKDVDLLCLGNPCADLVIRCERVPSWDDKCAGTAVGSFAGGTESNVACAASRLGWRTAVFGDVGDDAHGQQLVDAFAADAVDMRWLRRRQRTPSASTVLLVSPQGERAIVWVPMAPAERPAAELEQALSQARVAYTMPYDPAELARLGEAARRAGTLLAIDIEREAARRPELLPAMLGHCDIAFLNETGYTAGVGSAPDETGLRSLFGASRTQTLCVTLGARGAIAIDAGGIAAVPAFPVRVLDATGAGDTFNAAFLVARGGGATLADALRFACAAASHTVGVLGARAGMPVLGGVQALLGSSASR